MQDTSTTSTSKREATKRYGVTVFSTTAFGDDVDGVNLEGETYEGLNQFCQAVKDDSARAGVDIFPSKSAAESEQAVKDLAFLALHKANAMRAREKGDIQRAMKLEANVEQLYRQLPSWAQW